MLKLLRRLFPSRRAIPRDALLETLERELVLLRPRVTSSILVVEDGERGWRASPREWAAADLVVDRKGRVFKSRDGSASNV